MRKPTMAYNCHRLDVIKAALSSGTDCPCPSIIKALLGLGDVPIKEPQPDRHARPPAVSSTTKLLNRKVAKQTAMKSNVDSALTPRQRYTLATECVNSCLKKLSNATKDRAKDAKENSALSGKRKAAVKVSTAPRNALQPSSGNATPPPRAKAKESKAPAGLCEAEQIGTTVECAQLAFRYLCSADVEKLGIPTAPKLQLESGMAAIIGKLITLEMHSFATRQLRALKLRLEFHCRPPQGRTPSAASNTCAASLQTSEEETLAGLLNVTLDAIDDQDLLYLALAYQLLVLKAIAATATPGAIEAAVPFLRSSARSSPLNLISQVTQGVTQDTRFAKQLEAFSSCLLRLCPGVALSDDNVASDHTVSPSPAAVLELLTTALDFRSRARMIVGDDTDVDTCIWQPFGKCLQAFRRRTESGIDGNKRYQLAKECYDGLVDGPGSGVPCKNYSILQTLTELAQRSARREEAQTWAEALLEICATLEPNHARRVAAECAMVQVQLSSQVPSNTDSVRDRLTHLKQSLGASLTGQSAHYDELLAELVQLSEALARLEHDTEMAAAVAFSSAAFAQRYFRSYPRKNGCMVECIILAALGWSRTTDEALVWVTVDAADVFAQSGAMAEVVKLAGSKSLATVWSTSTSSAALSRVLQALTLRAIRTEASTPVLYEPESLDVTARGLLLEWQFQYALGLAPRSKYRAGLQKVMPELLRRLAKLYTADGFPLRRARVATAVLRVRASHPELLPPHLAKTWQDCPPASSDLLADDQGLCTYSDDVNAGLAVAQAFSSGRPTAVQLKPALLIWQRIIESSSRRSELELRVIDGEALASQLDLISSYLSMLGEEAVRLQVLRISLRLSETAVLHPDRCARSVDLAHTYLSLGYAEQAISALDPASEVTKESVVSCVAKLRMHLAYAEYYLAITRVDKAQSSLQEAECIRVELPPGRVAVEDRKTYELLHAQAWLVHSKIELAMGAGHDALAAAKQAVRVINSSWSALDRPVAGKDAKPVIEVEEAAVPDVAALTTGVSKLNLAPKTNGSSTQQPDEHTRGPAFWPMVPLLCQALSHLSDMYAWHGLFAEADYYSQRAISIAEEVGSKKLCARYKIHRSRLLLLAGQSEAAELCLEQATQSDCEHLDVVQHCLVKAAVCVKEQALDEALKHFTKAEQIVTRIEIMADFNVDEDGQDLAKRVGKLALSSKPTESMTIASNKIAEKSQTGKRKVAAKTAVKSSAKRAAQGQKYSKAVASDQQQTASKCRLLDQLRCQIRVERSKAILLLGGKESSSGVVEDEILGGTPTGERCVASLRLMRKAASLLQGDVSFSLLTEATLALPALLGTTESGSATIVPSTSTTKAPQVGKAKKQSPRSEDGVATVLLAAYNMLLNGKPMVLHGNSTSTAHHEASMLSNIYMLFSAMPVFTLNFVSDSAQQAMYLELPRTHANQCETTAAELEKARGKSEGLAWPSQEQHQSLRAIPSSASWSEDFVDILPAPWTAVSLSLNEDCTELFATRYRAGQPPLVVRLPFSRHLEGDQDAETFDYTRGKAELEDIIQASNYTCHSSGSIDVKGAKSNWWKQREALDKRLHELLINMENIWLGGFKSILSQHRTQPKAFARFRQDFEDTLSRHLPSRRAPKAQAPQHQLDDLILELFVGLESDNNQIEDLDEPLADLLYLVVDLLQFSGERNAYDEIDFDAIAIDVMDALRSYHDIAGQNTADGKHVILVLDKRLQAFPWESLPCLQDKSVSRVGSMLSLRGRILAMRSSQHRNRRRVPDNENDRHTVDRKSGTYILNPSSDLTSTQATLLPALTKVGEQQDSRWSSVINQAPSEDEFTSALSESSMLLYFGHGAGTQYIRPKNIRRLERCSEVVWLMGCSSGAVTEYGELEPFAVPLAYLMAVNGTDVPSSTTAETEEAGSQKCMAVVATLWDVTDKDIDRFSLAVGEEWGLWPASESSKLPAKSSKRREMLAAPSTPQQVPKTPKTPKARKTPAPTKTPARSRSRPAVDDGRKKSLVEAVAKSRDACYLRYLNGAAPVVYGVPVYLSD